MCTVTDIFALFYQIQILSSGFYKSPQISDFKEISPAGGALLYQVDRRTGGRTDMMKIIGALGNCANAPNKV